MDINGGVNSKGSAQVRQLQLEQSQNAKAQSLTPSLGANETAEAAQSQAKELNISDTAKLVTNISQQKAAQIEEEVPKTDQLAKIKESIENGNYPINAEEIAEKVLDFDDNFPF